MKYQITCDNCGTQFLINAEGGQTVRCACPHCHSAMEITLPDVAAGQEYTQPATDEESATTFQGEKQKKGHPVMLGIVLGILALGVLAFAFYAMNRYGNHPQDTAPDSLVDTMQVMPAPEPEPEPMIDTTTVEPVQQEEPQQTEQTETTQPAEEIDETVEPSTPDIKEEQSAPSHHSQSAKKDTTANKR